MPEGREERLADFFSLSDDDYPEKGIRKIYGQVQEIPRKTDLSFLKQRITISNIQWG